MYKKASATFIVHSMGAHHSAKCQIWSNHLVQSQVNIQQKVILALLLAKGKVSSKATNRWKGILDKSKQCADFLTVHYDPVQF